MKSSTYLRWVYSWWIAAFAILAFGVYAKAQTPAGVINAPIYATGYISQVGGTNVTTNILPQPNHPTNLNIYTTGAISGTWTIKLPNPAFEGQMLSFNCGAAANIISIVSTDGSSIDPNLPTSCNTNGGFIAQFDLRSNIWRSLGSGYTTNFRPFTGVTSQWPWQLNADGTWTVKQILPSDLVVQGLTANSTGAATANTAAINNAMAAVAANGGGKVWLPCGAYYINGTLDNYYSGVLVEGQCAPHFYYGYGATGYQTKGNETRLIASPGFTGILAKHRSPYGASNVKLRGGGFVNIVLDQNLTATKALEVDSREAGHYEIATYDGAGSYSVEFKSCVSGTDLASNCDNNHHRGRIRVYQTSGATNGVLLDGSANANYSFNQIDVEFIGPNFSTPSVATNIPVDCKNADNNSMSIRSHGTSWAVVARVTPSTVLAGARPGCTGNTFDRITCPNCGANGIYAEGAVVNAAAPFYPINKVVELDTGNGGFAPTGDTSGGANSPRWSWHDEATGVEYFSNSTVVPDGYSYSWGLGTTRFAGSSVAQQLSAWINGSMVGYWDASGYNSAGGKGGSLSGASSGKITFQTQAVAGTFNWNYPTSAGAAGSLLASGGGGTAPMTWQGVGSGVSAALASALNASGGLASSASPVLTGIVNGGVANNSTHFVGGAAYNDGGAVYLSGSAANNIGALLVSGVEKMRWDSNPGISAGLLRSAAAAPEASTCGTGPAVDAGSTPNAGKFTIGTGATACTLTFATAYPTNAYCTVTPAAQPAAVANIPYISAQSRTAFTISGGTASTSYYYTCGGN